MILYHGSPNEFTEFVINPILTKHSDITLREGAGIYMTEDKSLVSKFGTYIYEVEVDEKDIFDALSEEDVASLLEDISNDISLDISDYVPLNRFTHGTHVTTLYEDIIAGLDNSEHFHMSEGERITEEEDCIFESIKESFLRHLKPVIRHLHPRYGVNYIAIKTEPLHIVSREKIK